MLVYAVIVRSEREGENERRSDEGGGEIEGWAGCGGADEDWVQYYVSGQPVHLAVAFW